MDVGGGKKFRSLCPFHFFLLHFLLGYSALSLSVADAANSKLGSGHAVDSQKLSRCSEHFSPFFLSLYFMATLTAFGNCPLFNAPTPPTPLARTFFHGRRKHRPSIFDDIKSEIALVPSRARATLSFAITKVVARRRRVDRP